VITKSLLPAAFLAEYPIKVNLKSETRLMMELSPPSKHHRYRFKAAFSFLLEEMGCRVDCTVVQQADNVPVSELLRSAKRFEIEVEEGRDEDGRRGIILPKIDLHDSGTLPCTVLCTDRKEDHDEGIRRGHGQNDR
jgi:hypothetical protein